MSTLPCTPKLVAIVSALLLFFSTPLAQAVIGEQLTLSPQAVSFGNVPVGSHLNLPVTMTNSGTTPITITKRIKNGSVFWLTNVKYPINLAVGQSFRFGVNFVPASTGPASATFTFVSSTGAGYVLNVSGTGTPGLVANPANINFGNVPVGTRQSQSVAVTNFSSASVTIRQATVTGTGFGISGLTPPVSLSPGQSFTFTVTFTPPGSGTSTGNIWMRLTNLDRGVSIPLSGGASASGQLSVTPTSASFGTVTVGASKSMPATLTATGATVTVNSGSITNSEFSVSGLSLPLTLAPGQSASFTLSFTPNASGGATGSASFVSNASNSPIQELFAGTGSVPVNHSVTLSWNPDSSPVAGYNVYRGSASAGPFSRINSALDVTTGFNDANVQSGQTYYYAVTAVNSSGLESGYSNSVRAVIP